MKKILIIATIAMMGQWASAQSIAGAVAAATATAATAAAEQATNSNAGKYSDIPLEKASKYNQAELSAGRYTQKVYYNLDKGVGAGYYENPQIIVFNDLDTGEKICFFKCTDYNHGKFHRSIIPYEDLVEMRDGAKKIAKLHSEYPQHGDEMITYFYSTDGHDLCYTMKKGNSRWSFGIGHDYSELDKKADLPASLDAIIKKMEEIMADKKVTGDHFNK